MQDIGLDAEVKNAIEKDEVSKLKVAAKKYKGWKKVSKTVKECGFTQLSAEWGPWEFSLHYAILAGAEGCSFWLMTMCPGLLGVQLRHPDVRKGRLSDEDGVSEVKEDGTRMTAIVHRRQRSGIKARRMTGRKLPWKRWRSMGRRCI